MVPLERLWSRRPSPELFAVVVANAFPFVGIVALGWDLTALVILYWFELGILMLWALVRALFAGRPSELEDDPLIAGALASKPVAISIPRTGVGVQLSTLPVLAVVAPVLGVVWFFAGVTTVGVLGPDALRSETLSMVALALLAIFVGEGVSTTVEYFHRQGYREHSAQTAIQGVFMRGAIIGVGGMFTAMFVGLVAGSVETDEPLTAVDPTVVGVPLLVGIVLVKFAFDLAGLYRDRLAAFDERRAMGFGWAYAPPAHESIEPIESAARDPRRPLALGRLLGGITIANARRHPGALVVGGFLLLVGALFAMGRVWNVVGLFAAAGLVVPLGLLSIDHWLRYGGVEYRLADDAVVAYDRLFRTRLWRVESWDEDGLRVERDRLDAWLDASTVVIECPDRELRLPHLREVEPVLDAFDRQIVKSRTE
jgi:hypothetical protein